MSQESDRRAAEFLAIADQFKLGVLLTESSHPVTADLSDVARVSTEDALALLFKVDEDVLQRYRRWVEEDSTQDVAECVLEVLRGGGRIFFTGCGSTGRLSILLESIWRRFWSSAAIQGKIEADLANNYAERAFSAMAGGDFALIKAVEGFEDFAAFGRRQIADLGIGQGDVLFAITEGGETSWVIGTAWEGLERGATVYFVYNNPDELLVEHVQRSREVILEPRIRKLNLTTGPMAITGSTRMQATTIQLCVLLTVLEYAVRALLESHMGGSRFRMAETAPQDFLSELEAVMALLKRPDMLTPLARLVELEERVYRGGHRTTYFARELGVDVLTDTTERSPTFCTPPFRRYDDTTAAESWTFLTVPEPATDSAWRLLLMRQPRCVEWPEDLVRSMVPPEKADRTVETVKKIGVRDLMRFRIGMDGLPYRVLGAGDAGIGIVWHSGPDSQVFDLLTRARSLGAAAALVLMHPETEAPPSKALSDDFAVVVNVSLPPSHLLLTGAMRAGIKMLMNALSTCTMVRLGRVMGNYMVWVVPSNLKLIDRATRYVSRLTGLGYEDACRLVFDSLEYVSPRMLTDKAYPPVVGLSVIRARDQVGPEEAERRLYQQLGSAPPSGR